MAGKKLKSLNIFRCRTPASSLVEVIIAMVMIVVVFGIAFMIFIRVTSSAPSDRLLKSRILIQNALQNAELAGDYQQKTEVIDELLIRQSSVPYRNNAGLTEFRVAIYDGQLRLITEIKKVEVNRE